MKITHKIQYRSYGVRKITHFIAPQIGKWSMFTFPFMSTYHYQDYSGDNPFPDTRKPYLSYRLRLPLVAVDKVEKPIGRVRYTNKGINLLTKSRSKLKKFTLLEPGETITANSLIPIVYTYGLIPHAYRYAPNKINEYFEWYNQYSTVLETIGRVTKPQARQQYMVLEIPVNIPTTQELRVISKKEINARSLNILTTHNHFTIYDVWLWINPDTREKSLLSRIPPDIRSSVNIVLKHGTAWTLLNLKKLMDFIEPESGTGYDAKIVQKLWLALLHKVVEYAETVIMENNPEKPTGLVGISGNRPQEQPQPTSGEEELGDLDLESLAEEVLNEESTDNKEQPKDDKAKVESPTDDDILPEVDEEPPQIETQPAPDKTILQKVSTAVVDGQLSKAKAKKLEETLKASLEAPSPYGDGTKVKDNLVVTEEELKIDETEVKIPDSPVVIDKSMLTSTLNEFDSKYIERVMKKDIISSIHSVANAGVVIENHEIEKVETVLGEYEEHKLKLVPIDGAPSTIRFRLPVVNEDGEFKISGNTYVLRKQRIDYPIRKTAFNQVALTSYYGKVFITRGKLKKNDPAYWVRRQLVAEFTSDDSRISQLVGIPAITPYSKAPTEYQLISAYNKSITIGKDVFYYSYGERESLLDDTGEELNAIEKNGKYTLAGMRGKKPIVMDAGNKYYLVEGNTYTPIKGPLEILDINLSQAPLEITSIKVFRQEVPVVFLLLFYMGFNKLTKLTEVKYRLVDAGKRHNATDDEFVVRLKDKTIVFDRTDKVTRMLWGGLTYYKELKDQYFYDLNSKNTLFSFFSSLGISPMVVREFDLLNEMFVDPITKSILEVHKEPQTFIGLLIKSLELLKDDFFRDQQDLEEMVIRGYERFSGLIYKSLVQSIREHRNKSLYSRSKIDLNPFAVWKEINEDSAKVLVDDINPIACLKLTEEVTYLGKGGRSRETMNKASRAFHKSDIGVMSESSKDSGDVGINALLSANPKLSNLRGLKGEFNFDADGFTSVLSTSALLAPGAIYDDSKRTVFVSIQNSHVIPVAGIHPPYVRTGYETVLMHRLPTRYGLVAKEDGVVKSVTKDRITVEYKSGKKDYRKLGKKPTKEETHTAYIIEMYTDREPGYKFKAGEVLAFDKRFFSRDIFDKTKVVYNAATTINTAMTETKETHEDSCAISASVLGKLKTTAFKTKSIIINKDQEVSEIKMPGDTVNVDDILLIIENPGASLLGKLDEESKETLKNLKRQAPKAKLTGKIHQVQVFYNCEVEELSPSLQELVKKTDKALQKELGNSKITGRVTSEKSVDGRVLVEGDIEVKYFIEVEEPMGVGDKGIFANQMKTTIGAVITEDIRTSTGEPVEAFFGERSVQARIVISPKQIGLATAALKAITEKALEAYKK